MTKVLIVSKTKMGGSGVCVGGITIPDYKSVRLMNEGETYHKTSTDFQIDQVWEMDLADVKDTKPPHVENVIIREKKHYFIFPNILV